MCSITEMFQNMLPQLNIHDSVIFELALTPESIISCHIIFKSSFVDNPLKIFNQVSRAFCENVICRPKCKHKVRHKFAFSADIPVNTLFYCSMSCLRSRIIRLYLNISINLSIQQGSIVGARALALLVCFPPA